MRDDELDELLAVADRQFQRAFHAESDHRINGLAAVIGHEHREAGKLPKRHLEFPASQIDVSRLVIMRVPESLLRQIIWTMRALRGVPPGPDKPAAEDTIGMLVQLRRGLEDLALSREQALALVHQMAGKVSEALTEALRVRTLRQLYVLETMVERLFDDADDRAGRAR